jgi:hypothetical protein
MQIHQLRKKCNKLSGLFLRKNDMDRRKSFSKKRTHSESSLSTRYPHAKRRRQEDDEEYYRSERSADVEEPEQPNEEDEEVWFD